MQIRCQALNRQINTKGCALAQKELPKKFCEGCKWYTPAIEKLTTPKPRKPKPPGYTPSKYTIYIPNKLRAILAEESKKRGLKPRVYIAKILADKLLHDIEK